VAIRINDVSSVSGFVSTGSHVDVMISGQRPGGNGSLGTIARPLPPWKTWKCFSAGQELKKDAENKPVMVSTVNLLVTPEQAEATQPRLGHEHPNWCCAIPSIGISPRRPVRRRRTCSMAAAWTCGKPTSATLPLPRRVPPERTGRRFR